MDIYESGEMYLETILILRDRLGSVRSIDIANELEYSKPSVSRAVAKLKSTEYIKTEKDGRIVLSGKGEEKARKIYERHQVITKFLVLTLEVSEKVASVDACRVEHIIGDEVYGKIREYVFENDPSFALHVL